MGMRGQRQGGGSGSRQLLTPYQFVVLAEAGRLVGRMCIGSLAGGVTRDGMMRMVVVMAMAGRRRLLADREERLLVLVVAGHGRVAGAQLAMVLVGCLQVRRRQLVELFALGRCGGSLGRELLPQDLLVGGFVLVVLGRLLLAGLPGSQRGTAGCCIHLGACVGGGGGRLCVSRLVFLVCVCV